MNNSRLVFVGLYNDTNLGDPIIAQSTEWLFSLFADSAIERIRLALFPPQTIWSRIRRRIKRGINPVLGAKDCETLLYRHYEQHINKKDVIVVVGGGLIKYKYQDFYLALANLLKVAYTKKAIVVFNSVGVEGYDEYSPKCQLLKQEMLKATQNQTLVYISTRDDIQTLYKKYFDNISLIPCIKVADPAVWCSEAFNISRSAECKIIGVGIIRGNIFIDNDILYTKNELMKLYIDLIKELKRQHLHIKMFTNGTVADNLFAQEIQRELHQKENIECELILPTSSSELIHCISQFKGIIAGRLHSCIVAYSLGVPAVGLVWNDKLTLFGKNIGAEDNFITFDKFSPAYIVNQLHAAIQKGYDRELSQKFKQTVKDSIKEITQLYLH